MKFFKKKEDDSHFLTTREFIHSEVYWRKTIQLTTDIWNNLPSLRTKSSPTALSLVWRIEDQSWLLHSTATNSSIVSIPLLFLDHPLHCRRLFCWVLGSDHRRGLDIPLCPCLLLESPLVTCGSLALRISILCSSSCLSKCQSLNSSRCHQRKNLPLSMFFLRDQFYAFRSSIWPPWQNFNLQVLFFTLNIWLAGQTFLSRVLLINSSVLINLLFPGQTFLRQVMFNFFTVLILILKGNGFPLCPFHLFCSLIWCARQDVLGYRGW